MSSRSGTRVSGFRRDKKSSKAGSVTSSITPEVRKLREGDKEKLKKCNNRLVNYVEKVHDLEEANRLLASENAILRRSGKIPQQDVADIYEDEMKRLREKVEDLTVENKKLEVEGDNLEHELNETADKLDQEKEDRQQIEKEVKLLRKDVDDATIERVSLETKLENLQETLQLERQAHAVEIENLRSQVQPVHAHLVENEPSSLMPDLNEAIADVRKQYEAFNTKNVESLDAYYKEKMDGLNKQLKNTQDDNRNLRQENADQRKTIHQLEMELDALRSKTDTLERCIADAEDNLAKQHSDNEEKIHELTKELDDAKTDLGKYLLHCQELSNLKLSLEQEIAIYHKILQGEETRILDVEVADPKQVVRTPDRGRKTSRSSSRSNSPAAAKSKSRSRSRSRSKSRSRSRSHSSASSGSIGEADIQAAKEVVEEKVDEVKKDIRSNPNMNPTSDPHTQPSPANASQLVPNEPTSIVPISTSKLSDDHSCTHTQNLIHEKANETQHHDFDKKDRVSLNNPTDEAKSTNHAESKDDSSSDQDLKSNSSTNTDSGEDYTEALNEGLTVCETDSDKDTPTQISHAPLPAVQFDKPSGSECSDGTNPHEINKVEKISDLEPVGPNPSEQPACSAKNESLDRIIPTYNQPQITHASSKTENKKQQLDRQISVKDEIISKLLKQLADDDVTVGKNKESSSNGSDDGIESVIYRAVGVSQEISAPEMVSNFSSTTSESEKCMHDDIAGPGNPISPSDIPVFQPDIDNDTVVKTEIEKEDLAHSHFSSDEDVFKPKTTVVIDTQNTPPKNTNNHTDNTHELSGNMDHDPIIDPDRESNASSSAETLSLSSPRSTDSSSSRKRKKKNKSPHSPVKFTIKSPTGDKRIRVTKQGVVSVTWKVKGGTVRPAEPFNSDDDAVKLRDALKGSFGTKEKVIIDILAKRSKAQRLAIGVAYKVKYDDDLVEDLKKDLSGDFKSTALHLMWKRSVMDANSLRKAMKGFGTDEAVLIEILCTQSGPEIEEIKKAYAQEFPGRSLEEDIEKETTGAFKKFLLAVLKGKRPEDNGTVVANQADADAQELHNMKVKEWSPSNPKFLEIFTERSFEHLWFLFNQSWPKVSSDDLLETIEKECKGDLEKGLKTLIRFSVYIPPVYYATQLFEAFKVMGTEDNQIIYIVATRSEIDMIDIKEEFGAKYKTTLAAKIKDETSGDYKDMLLKIIDEE